MNLDNFKTLTKNVTAPVSAPSGDTNLGGFIAELRARDQWERRRLLGMALILLPVGLVFAVVGGAERPGTRLTGVGIMFVAAYMSLKGRWFGRVDYAAPAQEFLAAAAKRYRFWRAQDTLFAIPLLLTLGLGGGLTVWLTALKYSGPRGALLALAGYGLFLAGLCVFAWIVSRKQWRQESAGLLAEIERRRRELDNG